MNNYLYPTHPFDDWVKNIGIGWKNSNLPYFSLWFQENTPRKLIEREKNNKDPFWLYMYYTEKKTNEYCKGYSHLLSKKKQVEYRIRVVEFQQGGKNPFSTGNVYVIPPEKEKTVTIWFKCDGFEKIKPLKWDNQDFEHEAGIELGPTLIKGIPPIKLNCPIIQQP